jgi:hypothetical protein
LFVVGQQLAAYCLVTFTVWLNKPNIAEQEANEENQPRKRSPDERRPEPKQTQQAKQKHG